MPPDSDHLYPAGQRRVSRVVGGDLPRATAADAARTLAATKSAGTLATLAVEPAGYPFGSVVSFTVDGDGDPLFVISRLAVHTTNLLADPRASLLVAEAVDEGVDPLARSRVTLLGDVAPVRAEEQDAAVETVAARLPAVAGYASYGDFACYRLQVRSVRWVGGFGEMDWVDSERYRAATVDPVIPSRHGIIAHMDDDHADAGVLLCSQALGEPVTSASMSHVDRFGCEYVARLDDGQPLILADGVDVHWCYRRGRPAGRTSLLLDAVRAMPWLSGDAYAWGGAESRCITAVRRYVRTERGLPRTAVSMTGYWRHDDHPDDGD